MTIFAEADFEHDPPEPPSFKLREIHSDTDEIYEMEFSLKAARMMINPACYTALVEAVERWDAIDASGGDLEGVT